MGQCGHKLSLLRPGWKSLVLLHPKWHPNLFKHSVVFRAIFKTQKCAKMCTSKRSDTILDEISAQISKVIAPSQSVARWTAAWRVDGCDHYSTGVCTDHYSTGVLPPSSSLFPLLTFFFFPSPPPISQMMSKLFVAVTLGVVMVLPSAFALKVIEKHRDPSIDYRYGVRFFSFTPSNLVVFGVSFCGV